MRGKIFWGLVILLFLGIVIIPFLLPSDDAGYAEAQYYEDDGGDGIDIDFKKRSRKKYTTKRASRSVRSVGGSRSYRSGK
ncbi:MAG: hypothetical protein ACL93V_03305 [Candidatus Electrothrix sp. YB6]